MALTMKRVDRLVSKGERGIFHDKGNTRGLVLAVDSKQAASWGLRYQIDGRARFMGLGSAQHVQP